MNNPNDISQPLVESYLFLRKAIGIIGVALPFALAIGKWWLDQPGLESSMSAYYYTIMGDVFVGSLCAVGIFLMSYRGYEARDRWAGKLAAVFALGVALFPTAPAQNATALELIVSKAHYSFAAVFFGTLAYFCLVLFRKTDPSKPMTAEKIKRNRVYTVSGYTMLGSIFLLLVVSQLEALLPMAENLIFWLEAVMISAFGIAWLTKGEAILKDQGLS
ncbi:MAG: DUF998 domain-containing protein [Gammaproteobacteria bacterium]|nr:DUF998 domain-containing protein [Gammaproteobacteria bacterium]